MARCLLARSESLRLCFRSDLPGRWTLGESVTVTVTLESEAGVRVRHPHSNHVWAEPESALAREGLATGVPLKVVLGGVRTGRFLLGVASCVETDGRNNSDSDSDIDSSSSSSSVGGGSSIGGDGHEGLGRPSPCAELLLDLSTGTAKGRVTIFPALLAVGSPSEPPTPPKLEHGGASVPESRRSVEKTRRQRPRKWPWAPAGVVSDGCEVQGQAGGEGGGEVHLSISLPRAWARAFNRPVLPLESLSAVVVRPPAPPVPPPPARPRCPLATPELAPPSPNPMSLTPARKLRQVRTRGGVDPPARSLLVRDGACSVRRVRFEVRDNGGSGGCGTQPRAVEARRNGGENAPASTATMLAKVGSSRSAGAVATAGEVGAGELPRKASTLLSPSTTTASSSRSLSPAPSTAGEWSAAYHLQNSSSSNSSSSLSSSSNSSGSDSPSGGWSGGRRRNVGGTGGGNNNDDNDDNDDDDETSSTVQVFAVESVALGGFFGTLWDCSLEMGAFLASLGPEALAGKRVVELGAGCGVVSVLCAALGASEVVATEAEDVLPLLTLNLERNERRGFPSVKACEYSWGSPIEDHPALARGGFDVVVLSDLLYDPAAWEPLLSSLRQLTARRSGQKTEQSRRRRRSSLSAAAGTAVVYLAHRTRNAQEHQFFDGLVPSDAEGEEAGPAAAAKGESSTAQEEDDTDVSSFRYRKLGDASGEGRKEGCEGSGSSRRECRPREDEAGGLLWGRGCFPDVHLYELSPITGGMR